MKRLTVVEIRAVRQRQLMAYNDKDDDPMPDPLPDEPRHSIVPWFAGAWICVAMIVAVIRCYPI